MFGCYIKDVDWVYMNTSLSMVLGTYIVWSRPVEACNNMLF